MRNEQGYISVLSRTDDVINVAGHRLSCGHIEEVSQQGIVVVLKSWVTPPLVEL